MEGWLSKKKGGKAEAHSRQDNEGYDRDDDILCVVVIYLVIMGVYCCKIIYNLGTSVFEHFQHFKCGLGLQWGPPSLLRTIR